MLVVRYFPVRGEQIDLRATGDVGGSLQSLRQHTDRTTQQVLEALQQGSRYHGYKDPSAPASLRYTSWGHRIPGAAADLAQAGPPGAHDRLQRHHGGASTPGLGGRAGVKEVWVWGYHGGVVDLWESNMAGPFGDISNSDRDPHDLPVFSKTYTVYHYNYQRGPSEAVEDHMHQIEAVLRHTDPDLFWNKFVGKPGEGRCGWAHFPPNGERDYDWRNPKKVWTDIEDWRPDGGGQKIQINSDRWNRDSLQWFVYWMQNVPGLNNGITYRGRPLTNWWRLIGDFDGAMSERVKLIG